MSDPKFCKDCRFCKVRGDSFVTATCEAPLNRVPTINLVTGEIETTYARGHQYCSTLRMPGLDDCGPDAKWFEPREVAA